MSLDVYLTMPEVAPRVEAQIYIREDGQTKAISREEWGRRFPDRDPIVVNPESGGPTEVYHANITHNLARMAREAGIYEALWRPEEINITKARDLVSLLNDGLAVLQADPKRFKEFNPSNGWGTYEVLVSFVEAYLTACEAFPDADVDVSI